MTATGRRRALGQHFLRDAGLARSIVELAALTKDDLAVEIGPGQGALTDCVAEAAGRALLLEVDQNLFTGLQRRFGRKAHVEIRHADARHFSYAELPSLRPSPSGRVVVIGNLPYSVSKPILFRLIEARAAVDLLVLTLQREVADRIVAAPGSKRYGALSVLTQLVMEAKIAFNIPPDAFNPPPKVESSVVRMTRLNEPSVLVSDENAYRRVVKAAFGQRRKTLANSLSGGLQCSSKKIQAALEEAGIDPMRRAETLTLGEFARLAVALRLNEGPEAHR